MNEKKSSLRLDLLRFPLILAVIFIHNQGSAIYSQGKEGAAPYNYETLEFITRIISQEFSRIAVPIFFMISGYLFFRNFQISKIGYLEKIKSRIKSLFIPFLFWNLTTYFLVAIAQSWPTTAGFFSNRSPKINQMDSIEQIKLILGLGRFPISYQFWFIRDLIVLTLLTPFIYWISKISNILLIIPLTICWLFESWPIETPAIEATLFYSAGCVLGMKNKSIFEISLEKKHLFFLSAVYLLITSTNALSSEITTSSISHKIGVLLGIILILDSTKYIANTKALRDNLINLSGASFFVFAMHEPSLTIARKITQKIINTSDEITAIALYITTPIVISIVATSTYFILRSKLPKITSIISGGR